MADARYTVNDLPSHKPGAFTPFLTVMPFASSYGTVHVYGAPGTLEVASPPPDTSKIMAGVLGTSNPLSRRTLPSLNSPDVITPPIYYVMGPQERPPVPVTQVGSWNNIMPMPAINPGRVPLPAMIAPKIGGRRQTAWPRVFQRWPNWTGRPAGS